GGRRGWSRSGPSRGAAAWSRPLNESVWSPEPGLSPSMTSRAGKNSRICSAHWGYFAAYSAGETGSPPRRRSRNSAASRSSGSRSEEEDEALMRRPSTKVRDATKAARRAGNAPSPQSGQRRFDRSDPQPTVGNARTGRKTRSCKTHSENRLSGVEEARHPGQLLLQSHHGADVAATGR